MTRLPPERRFRRYQPLAALLLALLPAIAGAVFQAQIPGLNRAVPAEVQLEAQAAQGADAVVGKALVRGERTGTGRV